MRRASPSIVAVVEPVVVGLGYELVGAEFGQAENGMTLRVFIDNSDGILIDDCARVSHQLSGALDVDDVVPGEYLLEVSSPGVDRPLFNAAQFRAQLGNPVRLRTLAPIEGRRNYKGVLGAVEADWLVIRIDNADLTVPLSQIEQANLIGVLPTTGKRTSKRASKEASAGAASGGRAGGKAKAGGKAEAG